jgi:hypothetical protein
MIALIVIVFTIISAIIDKEHILKKEYIKSHTSRWCLRASFCLAIAIYNPIHGMASALLFYSLFDHLLNLLRELPFFYLGTVAKHDIFFNNKMLLFITIKSICLISSILLYFY